MNSDSRTKNSIRNIVVGLSGQALNILLNIISRSIFISVLNAEYLGVNGIFTNILTVLSLAELGVGSAIIYSMYKPIAEDDKTTLKALMNLYCNAYKFIGVGITIIGISIAPFLDIIIKNKPNIDNLTLIYLMFLANTVASYLFTYKKSMITADQRDYICSTYRHLFNLIKVAAQIIILYITKNFILFLLVQIICTLGENIAISYKANKLYPFLKEKNKIKLDDNIKKDIFKNIKSLMIYKVCTVMLDGTDNIIISSVVGVIWVGFLSNYVLIIGSIAMLLTQIFSAITASIGNIISSGTSTEKEDMFDVVFFASFLLYGFSFISLFILLNPFITLWIGSEYTLPTFTVLVLVLNFYILGMQNAVWTYRGTMGLFVYGRFRPLVSGIMNIILSIILAKKIGLVGVLLGTTITRIVSNVCYDPSIVFKYGFKKSPVEYYKKYIYYLLVLIISTLLTNYIASFIPNDTVTSLVMKIIICIVVPITIFGIMFCRKKEFKYLRNGVNKMLMKKIDNRV